jgi:D-alanyl-lipoteichoic acid acyltransferase DltB (MBOAT superfamily)
MIFTSSVYLYFFCIILLLYWGIGNRRLQNVLLLIGSYVFYGWVTPWFCLLIAASTVVDFFCGLRMVAEPLKKKKYLIVSLFFNLGLLGLFKYFDFFYESFTLAMAAFGLDVNPLLLQLVLPVGISFYTFQTLSYSIDIYRGKLKPRTNFVDFALFVSFFPQLVAGPIERAKSFLPQIEQDREWSWQRFDLAWPLIIRGFFKKMVIADNLSFYVDKVFMVNRPAPLLLMAGTFAFSLQIYADFSGYTDIARGSARMMGFELMKNFHFPYFSVSPSDFWERWHISLSSWIRDYLYISLGGSRQKNLMNFAAVIMITMTLCGLWHGAAWNYVLWGVYHGIVILIYYLLGLGGRWRPMGKAYVLLAWLIMFIVIQLSWLIFRAPSMAWLAGVLSTPGPSSTDTLLSSSIIFIYSMLYILPLGLLLLARKYVPRLALRAPVYALLLFLILVFHSDSGQDFIYFQF